MAIIQKQLIAKANQAGKPVITATQMLESMISSRLPTRAESTDVANAILDGTDCIMLSGESAMGHYPEEAVTMLASIAAYTELNRATARMNFAKELSGQNPPTTAAEASGLMVEHALQTIPCSSIFVPTETGATARMISRFKPPVWIIAMSHNSEVCQGLLFSYGIHPVLLPYEPEKWPDFASKWLVTNQISGTIAMLVTGPTTEHPDFNHRIEFIRVGNKRDSGIL
jgi:pyruvate kinase